MHAVSKGNHKGTLRNMQLLHRKTPARFQAFLLWGNSADHCTTMLLMLMCVKFEKPWIRFSGLEPGCYCCRWLVRQQGWAAQPPCLVPVEAHFPPAADCWWWRQNCCRSELPQDLPVTDKQLKKSSWRNSADPVYHPAGKRKNRDFSVYMYVHKHDNYNIMNKLLT